MSEIKTAEQRIHKLEGGEGDSFVTVEQALIAERDELRAALADRDAKGKTMIDFKLQATGIPESIEQYQLALDAAFTAGKAIAAGAAPVPCVVLTPEERAAFDRFHETWEDNEGYDVPKEMMRRLAEVGVVHHITAGRYDITKFGHYVLAAGAAPTPTGKVRLNGITC